MGEWTILWVCLLWYSLFFFLSPNSINVMKNKLDPEGLGIILLGPFLQEFFPDQVTARRICVLVCPVK